MIKKNFKNEKLPEIFTKKSEQKEDRAATTENKKIEYI